MVQRGRKILKLFKNYTVAVQQLFPEISFDSNLLQQCMEERRKREYVRLTLYSYMERQQENGFGKVYISFF
jgi:hypothetical protein